MFGLSINTLLLIFNTLLGGALKIAGMKTQANILKDKQYLEMYRLQMKITSEAREGIKENSPLSFMRNYVIFICVTSLVLIPIVATIMWDIPIYYVYEQQIKGGIFSHAKTILAYIEVNGIPIFPVYSEMLSSIMGLLFGYSIAGRK